MAFIPLINHSEIGMEMTRKVSVRIRPEGNSLGISFYNYEGEPLDINPRQSALVGNGFMCEMGSKADDGDFAVVGNQRHSTKTSSRAQPELTGGLMFNLVLTVVLLHGKTQQRILYADRTRAF